MPKAEGGVMQPTRLCTVQLPRVQPSRSNNHLLADTLRMHCWIDRPLRDGKDADEWEPSCASEAAANIEEWYRAGRLLFPRESLQDVRDQLRKPLAKGDSIFVKGFDGSIYEYPVRTGDTKAMRFSHGDKEKDERDEWVLTTPFIRYSSFEGLKQCLKWSLSRAYCSVGIGHLMVPVDQQSEPLGDVDAGLEFLNSVLRDWEESEAWREIKSTLMSLNLHSKVHKVIGIACGVFTTALGSRNSKRSAVQHALLLTLKKALQESNLGTEDIHCYAQDPGYSRTDQSVLERLGIKVVEDPDGFLEMDDRSLVFSCAPNICVKQIVADIVRPPILIWDTVREEGPEPACTDPNSPRVREMIRTCYDKFPFPENHGDSFTPMTIYVEKQGQVLQER